MKSRRFAALCTLPALAITGAALPTFGEAAAAPEVYGIEMSFDCADLGTLFVGIGVAGETGDEVDVFVNGELFGDSPYGPGDLELEVPGLEDGAYEVTIVDHASGEELDSETAAMMCNGPVIAAAADCEENEGVIEVWIEYDIYDLESSTFDVYVDGELRNDHVSGDANGQGYGHGIFEPGEDVLIEVYWNEGESDDPWYSATLSNDCGLDLDGDPDTDDGAGAGLPDSGSNTTPMMLAAGGLLAAGAAMLGLRRLRTS